MPKYLVTAKWTASVVVEAESEQEARDKFDENDDLRFDLGMNLDHGSIELDTVELIDNTDDGVIVR